MAFNYDEKMDLDLDLSVNKMIYFVFLIGSSEGFGDGSLVGISLG